MIERTNPRSLSPKAAGPTFLHIPVLQPFLLVYGGDPAHVPTIGAVVKQLREKFLCQVLSIQSWGEHEDWFDHVFM